MSKRKSTKLPFEATQAAIARENRISFKSAGAKRQRNGVELQTELNSLDLLPDHTDEQAIDSRTLLPPLEM